MSLGIALACLLGLTMLAWLLLPVVREASGFDAPPSDARSELEDLYIQREGIYATLKELDFDHETGKLMVEDYRELRARYSDEAIQILNRIDALEVARAIAARTPRAPKGVPKPSPSKPSPQTET
jgi:hypothetical protein